MWHETKHIQTETDAQRIEQSDAEVVLVGRSNAGKSSLINALCRQKGMAYVSQVPGKTRTINVYQVKPRRWIIDLPGYGFAASQKGAKANLGPIIEGYLKSRENLCMVLVLVDVIAGPTRLDILMINWLIHYKYPFRIVVNKIDKIGSLKLSLRQKEISGQLGLGAADIFWISSRKNLGIDSLRKMAALSLGV